MEPSVAVLLSNWRCYELKVGGDVTTCSMGRCGGYSVPVPANLSIPPLGGRTICMLDR